MSALATILSRMMHETDFAAAVLADAETALAEYELPAEELERFKQISRADFETLANASPEARQSMAVGNFFNGRFLTAEDLQRDQG